MENEIEKKKEASFVNIKASRVGQALFRELKKTLVFQNKISTYILLL
jgi:hypothetical protein